MTLQINPPPKDLSCDCCFRPKDELPKFPNGNSILMKTFREQSGCIGASWECYDCIGLTNKEWLKKRNEDKLQVIVKEKIEMIKENKN